MRTIGVVTVARSDYGIYRPILRRIRLHPELRLSLLVSGMHLSPEFGMTARAIEVDGFEIAERVEMLVASDSPEAIAKSMGLGLIGFGQVYARRRPDILVVLGDRFEMHAAALAALPFNIPLAHIHGGETTEGAIDEALRHSLTKMAHLHFVSTKAYAKRVVQMGEEPWRVTVSGAPGLDHLASLELLDREELERRFNLSLDVPPLVLAICIKLACRCSSTSRITITGCPICATNRSPRRMNCLPRTWSCRITWAIHELCAVLLTGSKCSKTPGAVIIGTIYSTARMRIT